MIGMEFIRGYGLGNHLFCYITARALAKANGYEFGCANQQQFANNPHSHKGMYFMDIDLGHDITPKEKASMNEYHEKDERVYTGSSRHDMTHGCYISGPDEKLYHIPDNTLIYGNMQDESYFLPYRDEIRQWLHVRPEYDSHEYTKDNLCIINMRGGEYTNNPQLYLDRTYWTNAIANMKKLRPDMHFMVVTEDEEAARKVLPEYEIHHFDMGRDYVTLKNARYLILSNSSFAVLAALTSETCQYIIAPKYWARHNVSNGYWSSEQNIYSFMHYQDRKGCLFTAEECRRELAEYKRTHASFYQRIGKKPGPVRHCGQVIERKAIYARFYARKIRRSLERRTGLLHTWTPADGFARDL